MAQLYGFVAQDSVAATGEGIDIRLKASKMGFLIVQDFYTQMAIEGRVYQVRAGTITAPLTGDVNVTDTDAEMCVDAPAALTVMPVYLNVNCEAIGGTLPEVWAKSVGTASTAGTVFVPLNLNSAGGASTATARVSNAAGEVQVTAELATTTLQHYGNTITAQADRILADHEFRPPPVLVGVRCFYVQVAATATGCTYFGHVDFIELPTTGIS